ncbi:MAG: hypothetical protein U0T75_09280 [Chitinophagales bacterium]
MLIVHRVSGEKHVVVIEPVTTADYKTIKRDKRFPNFDWGKEKKNEVYKLRRKDSEEILGLMSITDFKNERWIKINLLETSNENVGSSKQYDNIAGCLIAYTCRMAFLKGYDGVVALHPKTELVRHYIDYYGFIKAGTHLYTELKNSEALIKKYLS